MGIECALEGVISAAECKATQSGEVSDAIARAVAVNATELQRYTLRSPASNVGRRHVFGEDTAYMYPTLCSVLV